MRTALLLLVVLGSSACATTHGGDGIPIAAGASVTDIDRGASTWISPDTGTPSGAPDTIGSFDFDTVRPALPAAVAPPVGRTPRDVRDQQEMLSRRGYYHGPINGVPDESLDDAMRRYQADANAPVTSPPKQKQAASPPARF